MKKLLFTVLTLMLAALLFVCCSSQSSFEQKKADREKIAAMVASADLEVGERGIVALPEEYASLSDSGECALVSFPKAGDGAIGLYFWDYRGPVDASKGVVCIIADLPDDVAAKAATGNDFVNVEKLGEAWYQVSTD